MPLYLFSSPKGPLTTTSAVTKDEDGKNLPNEITNFPNVYKMKWSFVRELFSAESEAFDNDANKRDILKQFTYYLEDSQSATARP